MSTASHEVELPQEAGLLLLDLELIMEHTNLQVVSPGALCAVFAMPDICPGDTSSAKTHIPYVLRRAYAVKLDA